MIVHATISSPFGTLDVTLEDDALAALRFDAPAAAPRNTPSRTLDALVAALDRYWAGEDVAFDMPVVLKGTPFQTSVWRALREVPRGRTITYAELARRIGKPRAVRAVGRANGANPIAIIVPCHRVIGSNGALTGYGGGIDRKRRLLELERA
jgi:methylated-DNA-[protein]-cysteine S-methyltransferase